MTVRIGKDRLEGHGGKMAQWIREHLDYPDRASCLIWPFGQKGGGYGAFGPPNIGVHRLMCEYMHGPAPSPKHHAAHSCGRGHDCCVNPHHVSWKTPSENAHDRVRHAGGVSKRAKLTAEQVKEIVSLAGRSPVSVVAKEYKIAESAIRAIQTGKRWNGTSSLTRRVFSDDEVREMRSTPIGQKTHRQFAEQYGVQMGAVERVRARRSYKWVTS